jgi:TPR repeat protein
LIDIANEMFSQSKYKDAAAIYKFTADMGNANGEHKMAVCNYLGKGVKPDKSNALQLFRSAAGKGNVQAQDELVLIASALFESQRYYDAIDIYSFLANLGRIEAQLKLGDVYFAGISKVVGWGMSASIDLAGKDKVEGAPSSVQFQEQVKWYVNKDIKKALGYFLAAANQETSKPKIKWAEIQSQEGISR